MSNEITRQEFDEFRHEMREFKESVTDAFGILLPMVSNVLEVQNSTLEAVRKNSKAIVRLRTDTKKIKELQEQTLEYTQSWAGDVKKVLRHLGIEEETDA